MARPSTIVVELIERSMIGHRIVDMLVGVVLAMLEHDFEACEIAMRN